MGQAPVPLKEFFGFVVSNFEAMFVPSVGKDMSVPESRLRQCSFLK